MKNYSSKNKKIIIVAGGSGGHVFPSIAVIDELIDSSFEILMITDKRGLNYKNLFPNITIRVIESDTPFGKNNLKKILFLFKIIPGLLLSFWILLKFSPRLIIGFGGYPSFPPIMIAYLLRIPIIIHEQNLIMGRANRFLGNLAKKILISQKDTKNILPKHYNKTLLVGNPIRKEICRLRSTHAPLYEHTNKFNILIFGGSQGASIFSNLIPLSLSLLPSELRSNINIVQQVVKKDLSLLEEKYKELSIPAKIETFFDNLPLYMHEADIIISRAGATSIDEFRVIGKPSILIPLSHSIDNDQYINAKKLENDGACILVEEKDLNEKFLSNQINYFYNNREVLTKMSLAAYATGNTSAAKNVANLILTYY
ncbi:MAG: undecaprenyldiphospho-muramoylpentapeptide beta-N-acetylglucosaminyltransferase [Alphaproteobacteria bacterium]